MIYRTCFRFLEVHPRKIFVDSSGTKLHTLQGANDTRTLLQGNLVTFELIRNLEAASAGAG